MRTGLQSKFPAISEECREIREFWVRKTEIFAETTDSTRVSDFVAVKNNRAENGGNRIESSKNRELSG